MFIQIPDAWGNDIAGALRRAGAGVIVDTQIVPAFVHKYAEVHDSILTVLPEFPEDDYWHRMAVGYPKTAKYLRRAGLL